MVNACGLYLLLGQDTKSKDIQLKKLREQFLKKGTEEFDLDTLHAKSLSLKYLQERLLCLPADSPQRMVVIKEAESLKKEHKDFLIKYVRSPYRHLVLVLDAYSAERRDVFWSAFSAKAKTMRFQEAVPTDTFALCRQIEARRPDASLRVLKELLKQGNKPEWIMGALRANWQRNISDRRRLKIRLKALLQCDIDIKTGSVKPSFALEKLVVALCGL